MAIRYKPSFEYRGNDAINLTRGVEVLADQVKKLSMPDLRMLVCRFFGSSYAELSKLLEVRNSAELELTEDQARTLLSLASAVSENLTLNEKRKLRTWMGDLINDLAECDQIYSNNQESIVAKPEPLANAS